MVCKKLAFIIFISAALAFPQIGNLKFNKLTIKDGLSYNTINDITQDTCGYIWIGTENGLNRYDGYKLKSFFASDDSLDLSNNNIEALTVDRQGRLWIGTLGGGFYRFDALNNGFIKYDKYLYITDFAEDNYGNLWLATDSDGLIKFNPDNQEYIQYKVDYNNYENTISYDDLETLKFINDTTLLIGTPVGLDVFDLKTERFKNLLRSDQLFVTDIAIDKNNDIWVSTAANGIYIYSENLKLKTQKHKNNSGLGDNAIYTLLSDEEKNIWIGTETKGLYLYEYSTGEFRNYDHSLSDIYSLNHNSIDCLFDDGKGTLWVGTYNGGVNYAQKSLKKFRHYYASSPPYGLNNNVVTAFLETLSGEIWIGTDGGGINIFDPARGTFRYLTSDSTSPYILSSNYVLHLYQDSQNNIWVSSYDGGITVINEDRESVRYLTHDLMGDQILPGNFVRHVSEDSQNNIWIVCTSDGLVKYSPQSNQIKIYRFDQDQNTGATTSYNFLQNIMEDSRKNLWIGTLANGLILFDPVTEEYTRFRNNPQDTTSISSNFINDFVEDENNSIWIATKNGLNVYDYKTGKFRITKNAKKLPASNILSLEIDNTGFLWLGTSNGLSRLKFRTEKIKNYYEHNGLQSNQFNLKAAMKDKQGNLYFGGVYGFNIFNPENMPLNKFIPEVIFSDLIIFNKTIDFKKNRDIIARPVNFADEINLSYKDYFFTIEFTANNYIENQNNRYIYKLKGFDNRWNLVNHPGKAVYTNIPPGQYTFTVKASNNDNRWNKNGKSITINIQPPYWETLVFKISIVLLVLLLIYLYVILKTQSIRKRNRILKEINVKYSNEIERRKAAEKSMQIAVDKANEANRLKSEFLANISHEIRTPLNSVIGFSELLKQMSRDKTQNKYIQSIKSAGKTLLQLINDILDLSKIEAGKMKIEMEPVNVKAVMEELQLMFIAKIEEKNLELMVDIDDQLPDIFEFDEIRVRQILINLIGNAIKFTDQGYIKISLNVYNKTADTFDAEFTVTDTGRGIEEDQLDHIFKSFQQNKFQKQNQYGGTGLGLAITKRLVNMMGGSIQISSKIGEGSTFSVLFKNLKITKTTALEKKDKFYNIRKIHFPGKTILVVEDIDSNLEIITKLLEKVSISVMNAQNGEEALILLENTIPDLVLMDINMPVMDGITATRIIRQREGLKNLPVVALTATAEQFTKNELTKLFDYVIHKPIDNSLLINVLSKFLHYKEIPVADSQKEQVETGDCPVESILEDQDLMKELATDFIHKVPVLLDEMMIDNIKNFAESLAILGHKHNNQCLANYAETLLESANSFDIANLQMWLNKFMDNLSEAEK